MYSLEYPASWYTFTEPNFQSYVGTDFVSQDIQTPILLRGDGIWLTVSVDSKPSRCSAGSVSIPSTVNVIEVSIDGFDGVAYISSVPGPFSDGLVGVAGPQFMHKGWCYSFGFLTTSIDDTHLHMAQIEHIYASFRFNR